MDSIVFTTIHILLWALLSSGSKGVTVPLWDIYKWGSNHQAWCRFPCDEKIDAGIVFQLSFSGTVSNFNGYSSVRVLSNNGSVYYVENNYDTWGDKGVCAFQFGVVYRGTSLDGNCSIINPSLQDQLKTKSRDIPLAMWSNRRAGTLFRYRGRCTTLCSGVYRPGTLKIRILVDKATTNLYAHSKYKPTVPTETLTRGWTVVNTVPVRSDLGLCHVDFRFDHQSQYPEPRGSCHVL